MTRVIVLYHSFSGNTKETAELIRDNLEIFGVSVDIYDLFRIESVPELSEYDAVFFGTFTWDQGATPDEVKDFVADLGYKPERVFVFGSGDTQFGGDELFCLAAEKLARFYHSPLPPLKIEQSPRGRQESAVSEWVTKVVKELIN